MARTPTALVRPALLRWARESYGLSLEEAARKIGVAPKRLESWERGDERPTVAQLRKVAGVYKRPLSVFFLPEPPRDFDALRDFRRLPETDPTVEYSPELRRHMRRAQEIREAALELAEGEGPGRIDDLRAAVDESPEDVAGRLRGILDVTLERQKAWTSPYQALREWRRAVEGLGALVLQMSRVGLREARGFSVTERPIPVIVLNPKDHPHGKIFTLMHELGHVLLSESGVCEWTHPSRSRSDARRIEAFCNHLAGAVLVPSRELLAETEVASPRETWGDEVLTKLARRYQVSREVILRRLVLLGYASAEFYEQRRERFLREYEQRSGGGGAVPYERRVVNAFGTAFVERVLDAYHERRISLSSVAGLLDVRVRHLRGIEEEVFGDSRLAGAAT